MAVIGEPIVGEVRAKFTVINATDEILARSGQMPAREVRSYEADALVDTGAVRCVLPANVVEQLGLTIRGQRVAEYADGRKESVGGTAPVIFAWQGRDTVEEALVLGDEVIVGQTVLEKLDVFPDCARRQLIANPAHPDQPVTKVK